VYICLIGRPPLPIRPACAACAARAARHPTATMSAKAQNPDLKKYVCRLPRACARPAHLTNHPPSAQADGQEAL
jgi:hypothetical protein